jgi:enoyl-CoA hydratase/carnithine racemase
MVREWLGKDTWLSAKEALDAGLADEIVERTPSLRPSVAGPAPILTPGPTEDEQLLQSLLTGMGTIQVQDPEPSNGGWRNGSAGT